MDEKPGKRRRLFDHGHERRSLRWWVVALVVVLLVMFLLPTLLDRLAP